MIFQNSPAAIGSICLFKQHQTVDGLQQRVDKHDDIEWPIGMWRDRAIENLDGNYCHHTGSAVHDKLFV